MKELLLSDILQNTQDFSSKKVGYVAIVGRPNVGKSTFLNTLLGEKVSITSSVPQTTRKKVLGIYNDTDSQIIFVDTPGIHKSEKILNKSINAQALGSLRDVDLVLYFVDSSRILGEEETYIKSELETSGKKLLLIGTKSDLERLNSLEYDFLISSQESQGFEELLTEVKKHLPLGPMLFPKDMYTKQDVFFRISEIIREKVFQNTKEEIPHSIYVAVEEADDTSGMLRISAYIYTDSESQKYIMIGK